MGEQKVYVAHPLCSIQKVICSQRQHSGRWPGDKTTKYANKVNMQVSYFTTALTSGGESMQKVGGQSALLLVATTMSCISKVYGKVSPQSNVIDSFRKFPLNQQFGYCLSRTGPARITAEVSELALIFK